MQKQSHWPESAVNRNLSQEKGYEWQQRFFTVLTCSIWPLTYVVLNAWYVAGLQ